MISKIKLNAISAGVIALTSSHVFAQSSVTLYGVIDNSIAYQSSQAPALGTTSGGKSVVKLNAGVWNGSRFGFKGSEDLGGGTRAIFQLESGYNNNNGAQQYTNAMFGRGAWVGVTNPTFGTLTAGRQNTPYYLLLSSYGPTNWLTGAYGAHPGDIDAMDSIYRTNSSVMYQSPTSYGVTVSGMYALAGVPGSVGEGSTWSTAIQYANGPVGLAVGFMRMNNATVGGGSYSTNSTSISAGQPGISALTNGYQTDQAQQRFAVAGAYKFNDAWDISATYSNVQFIPGVDSSFHDKAIFNTAGAVLHWKPSTVWDFAAGYSYTRATQANGITKSAQYQQFNLSQYYSLSKRTGLYAVEAFQRASGNTLGTAGAGDVIAATPTLGDGGQSTPGSSRSLFGGAIGIVHRF
jgi:predicted porin